MTAKKPAKPAPTTKKPTVGQAPTPEPARKKGGASDLTPQFWARTRELFETQEKCSPAKATRQACEEFGIANPPHHSSVAERKTREGWAKRDAGTSQATPAQQAPQPAQQTVKAAPNPHQPAPVAAKPAEADPPDLDISPAQELFVNEWLIDFNGTRAYLRAFPGVKTTTASSESSKLLGNPKVRAVIEIRKKELMDRLGITQEMVLHKIWQVATADPRELMEYRRGACRHCYGAGFLYQRTPAEMTRDRASHEQKRLHSKNPDGFPPFSEEGGLGWNATKDPNPECIECFGEGVAREFFHDTRNLSPEAAALYAGVKVTKDGLEIKTHPQHEYHEKLARYVGLYEEDNRQQVPQGFAPKEELEAAYQRGMEQTRLKAEAVAGRAQRMEKQGGNG